MDNVTHVIVARSCGGACRIECSCGLTSFGDSMLEAEQDFLAIHDIDKHTK